MNKKFQADQNIEGHNWTDHTSPYRGRVISRTAKTVTVEVRGQQRRCKIYVNDHGDEYCKPFGSYSLAPCFFAI